MLQIEATTCDASLEDVWLCLHSIGYNRQLELVTNCPCTFIVRSDQSIDLREPALRPATLRDDVALAEFFWNNGKQVEGRDIPDMRLWKGGYFAVCTIGPKEVGGTFSVDFGDSTYTKFNQNFRLKELRTIFQRITILFYAVAINDSWSVRLKVSRID
ncbi:hypothetical protein AB6A40_001374 [Gnathostoma spinigerum]|uniref:Uncharacterized protein n=1 Tax=Gnathostoma spinigerum TaxID=75299 RepID=A0ABD6E513_9BILA